MAQEILLPKLGLTMQEGTVGEWLIEPGAVVKAGDSLLRLETDKVDVEVEAEGGGVLHHVAEAGSVLPPGALIGWLLADGEEPPASLPGSALGSPPSDAVAVEDSAQVAANDAPLHDSGAGTGRRFSSPNARRLMRERDVDIALVRGTGPQGRVITADVEDFLAATDHSNVDGESTAGVVSPLVRRAARDADVQLRELQGTGAGGRVTRADVEAARVRKTHAPAISSDAEASVSQEIPLRGMRGTIAQRMHSSLQEMAQLTITREIGVDAVVDLRAQLKEQIDEGVVASINDFIVAAIARELPNHVVLNASVGDASIQLYSTIDIGVAVAVDGGLVVPVIRNADQQSIQEIGAQMRVLAAAARDGTLELDQMAGATFTVTSLGAFGVDAFTPIINPGNTAILGVGRVRDGVAWEGPNPVRTQVMTLSLTFDHRAVDGAPAAEFLRDLEARLARPLSLL